MNLSFWDNIFKKLLFIFPIFVLISFVFIFSVDVPWYDDVMIMAFVRNLNINGWDFRILQQLFTNYNEHILVVTKLLFWLNQKIMGHINFSFLSIQGLLFYILFIILFIKNSIENNYYLKLASVLLLSSLTYDDGYLWAMSSIQNFASLLFSFLSLLYISKQKFSQSVICLLLGLVSSGQSLVFLPIWILIVIYFDLLNWKIIVSILFGVIFYFSGYEKTGTFLLSFDKQRIIDFLTLFFPPFGSLGLSFTLVYSLVEITIFCFVIYRVVIDYKNKSLDSQKIILAGILIWATGVLMSTFIVRVGIESRYQLYSILKTTSLYIYVYLLFPNKIVKKIILFFSLLFYSTTFLPSIIKAKNTHLSMISLKYNLNKNRKVYFYGTNDVDARKINSYYHDLKSNEIVNIPKRLNGSKFSHLLLFNQMANIHLISSKSKKVESLFFNKNTLKRTLIAKNITVDSGSNDIIFEDSKQGTVSESYFILLASTKDSLLFNYKNSTHSNSIGINKVSVPYGIYDLYFLKN